MVKVNRLPSLQCVSSMVIIPLGPNQVMLTTDLTSSEVTVTLHNNETSVLSNIRPVVLTLDSTNGVGTVKKSNQKLLMET